MARSRAYQLHRAQTNGKLSPFLIFFASLRLCVKFFYLSYPPNSASQPVAILRMSSML